MTTPVENKIPVLKDPFVWRNIFAMLLFVFTLMLITSWWLKCYTRHGQELILPDFINKTLSEAKNLADAHDYSLVIIDSIFMVDKVGSIILQQTPGPGSLVKEDRKVYIVVTKSSADLISLSSLPQLYGRNFEAKKAELEKGFDIKSNIIGYMYDAGPVDYIMAAIYNNDTILSASIEKSNYAIPKGATLNFILSTDTGAKIPIPDIVCMDYVAASFLLTSLGLVVMEIEEDVLSDKNKTFIVHQEPLFDAENFMKSGDTIRIYLNPKNQQTALNNYMNMELTVEELKTKIDKGESFVLIDVRESYEFDEFNLGGVLIPLGDLFSRMSEMESMKEDELIIYCRSGNRSAMAQKILLNSGFKNVLNLKGGIIAWQERIK